MSHIYIYLKKDNENTRFGSNSRIIGFLSYNPLGFLYPWIQITQIIEKMDQNKAIVAWYTFVYIRLHCVCGIILSKHKSLKR